MLLGRVAVVVVEKVAVGLAEYGLAVLVHLLDEDLRHESLLEEVGDLF